MDDATVLDDLDPVHQVPAPHAGLDLAPAGEGNLLAHHGAVDGKVEFDPVAGHGVGAPIPQRVEDCLARQLASLDDCQAFAISAGVAEMVVRARHDSQAMPLAEIVLQRVARPAAALGVTLVGVRCPVVLGAAPFGVDLQHRRHRGVDAGRRDAAMPEAVGGMVGNQDAAPALRERLELVQPLDQFVVAVQVREEDVVVAFHRAVTLVAEDRGEGARVVELARQPHDIGPARLRHREAVLPLVLDLAVVFAHVRPVRMRREGVEVEVVAGHLEAAL